MRPPDWSEYLDAFHAAKAGITEQVLHRARDAGAGADAYAWLAAAVPGDGVVLDLACGNAALAPYLPDGGRYVGVDASAAELARGGGRTVRGRLVRGRADALPVSGASVGTVACSMGFQVVTPLPAVVAEVARVLVPGGRLVFTVPGRDPLRRADRFVVGGLVLGRGLRYPNDELLRRVPQVLGAAGLRVLTDERRRFGYRLDAPADADRFLASLYLPGLPRWRYRLAGVLLRGWARLGVRLPVPVRRVVAVRCRPPG